MWQRQRGRNDIEELIYLTSPANAAATTHALIVIKASTHCDEESERAQELQTFLTATFGFRQEPFSPVPLVTDPTRSSATGH